MAECEIIGTVKDSTGLALAAKGTKLSLVDSSIPLTAHSARKIDYFVDENGLLMTKTTGGVAVQFAQGADIKLYGKDVNGFNRGMGAWVHIPDTATVDINTLAPPDAEPSTSALNAEIAARVAAQTLFTQTIDGDTALDIGDALRALILIDTAGGDVTATLQPLADMEGREIVFKKISDDNTAIVDADASELIDGSLVFNLEMMNQSVRLAAADSGWYIV